MKLYHGTTANISDEFLKPHKPFETYEYKPTIFFSNKLAIALLYSINPIRSYIQKKKLTGRANAFSNYFKYNKKENKVVVCEYYDGMLEEVYNERSFIYVINENNLNEDNETTSFEFYEPKKYDEKIIIPNVLNELIKYEKANIIKIIRFNELTTDDKSLLYDAIADRANACENQCEIDFFKEKFKDIYTIQNALHLNKKLKN